jgi:hypothetical protein
MPGAVKVKMVRIVIGGIPYTLKRAVDGNERWEGGPLGGTVWRRPQAVVRDGKEFRAGIQKGYAPHYHTFE